MGRERLKEELRAKGLAETVVEQSIRKAFRGVDEEVLARSLLRVRNRRGHRPTAMQALRLLRQRGFDEETIDRVVGPLMAHEESQA